MKNCALQIVSIAVLCWSNVAVSDLACGNGAPVHTINGLPTWKAGSAVVFVSPKLSVDADGAPNSYLVDGKGLSYTCDGVLAVKDEKRITPDSDPQNWQVKCRAAWANARATDNYSGVAIFGFLTDSLHRPLIQGQDDPLPGKAFISTTSVSIPGAKKGTQFHEVDATSVPYIVLPTSFILSYGVKPGDISIVYRKSTKQYAFAVYGDKGKLGEASVKLHEELGSKPIVAIKGIRRAKAGINDTITTVVFPGRSTHPTIDTAAWQDEIRTLGQEALQNFGGVSKLEHCAK